MKKISYKLKNSNIKKPHKNKQTHNHTQAYTHTLSTNNSLVNVVLVRRVSANARAPSGPMLL